MKKLFSILFLNLFLFNTAFANIYYMRPTGVDSNGITNFQSDPRINTDHLVPGSTHFLYKDEGDQRTWYRAIFVGNNPQTGAAQFDSAGEYPPVKINPNDTSAKTPVPPQDFNADTIKHDSLDDSAMPGASGGSSQGTSTSPGMGGAGGFGNSVQAGIEAGASAALLKGGADLIYRYVVMSKADRTEMEKLGKEINLKQDEINAKEAEKAAHIKAGYQALADSLGHAFGHDSSPIFSDIGTNVKQFENDSYNIKTKDPHFSKEIKVTRAALNSVVTYNPERQIARDAGLAATEVADEAYSSGDKNGGAQMLEYAKGLANIAIGWDPITGPIRDTYEAVSGKNLITGEKLDNVSRGFAIFGAVTFGFGSKIGRGLKMISRMAEIMKDAERFEKAAQVVERGIQNGALRAGMNSEALRGVEQLGSKVVEEVMEKAPQELEKFADILEKTKNIEIKTPQGLVQQEKSVKALEAYKQIESGERNVIRQGEFGKQRINYGADVADKPNYWSQDFGTKTPQEYMQGTGAMGNKVDFVEQGRLKDNAEFVTRTSPPSYDKAGNMINPGGQIEVVVKHGDVETTFLFDHNGIVK